MARLRLAARSLTLSGTLDVVVRGHLRSEDRVA